MGFFNKIKDKVSSVTSSAKNAITTAVEKSTEAFKFTKLKIAFLYL